MDLPLVVSIYDYTDYRRYLHDYYEEQKTRNPAFSYRYFAKKAGFNSSGLYKDIVNGRTGITRGLILRFAAAMKLSSKQQEYFETMVYFNEAKTVGEKQLYFERLMKYHGSKAFRVDATQYQYYSKWYYVAVRELLAIGDFNDDYSAIAKALKPAGAIQGVVKLSQGGDPQTVCVLAFGISRFAAVDRNGCFIFTNLAAANYDLRLISSLDNYGVLDTSGIPVLSGATTNLDTVELPYKWLDPDMIAHWSFDEGEGAVLHDWSGNGHDGAIFGSPQWTNGISGKALCLDGIDDYAVIPDHDALTNQSTVSVELWMKLRSHGNHVSSNLISKWGAGGSKDDSWHIAIHNYGGNGFPDWIHRPDWALSNGVSRADAYTRNPIPLKKWVHLVGTWDGDSARIYMNGELQGVKPWSKPLNNNATALYLGRSEPPAGDFVDGRIDEVKIYNRALSAAEVHHYSLKISSTDETGIAGGIMQPALKKISVKTTARAIIIYPDRRISGTVSLFDITGKRIRTVCVGPNGECAVIPMENQAKGMYVVRIASGGRAVFSTRIIVDE